MRMTVGILCVVCSLAVACKEDKKDDDGNTSGTGGSAAGTGGTTAGTGGSEAGTGGTVAGTGGSVAEENDCDEIAAELMTLATELECVYADILPTCTMVYAMDKCVAEFEALFDCTRPKFNADSFFCDAAAGDRLRLKPDDVCQTQNTAFNTCFAM